MAKYILKESELRSAIDKIVAEEVSNVINEGFWQGLKNAAWNTAKLGAKSLIAPSLVGQDIVKKTSDIAMGKDTITGTVNRFFQGNAGAQNAKKSKRETSLADMEYEERIEKKYGRPVTTSKLIGRKEKLAGKVRFQDEVFGNLGRHYQDEDGVWTKLLENKKQEVQTRPNARRRLARWLKMWLDERDARYEDLIKRY